METLSPSPPRTPRPRRRAAVIILVVAGVVALALIGACRLLASRVTLNVTTSMPAGLYWLRPGARLERGTVVVFACPPAMRALVAARHYLPATFKLLKRVAAVAGDRVCLDGDRYVVGDQLLSSIATHDHLGRPLRPFLFCGLVPDGYVFVAAHGDSSLDSRYFGPVPIFDLTPAVPLWTLSSP